MLQNKYASLITLSIAFIAAWLSHTWFFVIDTTSQGRNSLADSTVGLLKKIKEPITIKAFISDIKNGKAAAKLPSASSQREKVKRFIARFQRVKPNLYLELIDHKKDISIATKYGVIGSQVIIVEYLGKQKKLKLLDEYSLTHTILQLVHKQQTWIVFTEGNGERSPYTKGNKSLSRVSAWLKLRNSHIQALDLNKHNEIPKNTSVLVIASPTKTFTVKSLGTIIRYINRGGNLLWLHDPHNRSQLDILASKLGIEILPGIIVDRDHKQQKTLSITLQQYPKHKLVNKLTGFYTLFPFVSAITHKSIARFNYEALLTSHLNSWNETSIGNKQKTDKKTGKKIPPVFNPKSNDRKGPLNFGLSLTRTIASSNKRQRIVVIGDSDFLSNGFLNRGVNQSFAMNIFAWLSHNDTLIDIDRPKVTDYLLDLSARAAFILLVLFAIIIPIAFTFIGTMHYRKRKQQQ